MKKNLMRLVLAGASAAMAAPALARPLFGPGDRWPVVASIPGWLGFFIALGILAVIAILIGLISAMRRGPVKKVTIGGSDVELWVRERRFPMRADAIIVPAAPNLRMINGIAKWVRDASAGKVEREAEAVAPLAPGQAFIGSGGRYRFRYAVLAVVMDNVKLARPEWIADGIARALELARERGAKTCILADMTEDLIRHPRWITDDLREETAGPVAAAMLAGIAEQKQSIPVVRIWVWRAATRDAWIEQMDRAARGERSEAPARAAV